MENLERIERDIKFLFSLKDINYFVCKTGRAKWETLTIFHFISLYICKIIASTHSTLKMSCTKNNASEIILCVHQHSTLPTTAAQKGKGGR
jgi:hypothetical protein